MTDSIFYGGAGEGTVYSGDEPLVTVRYRIFAIAQSVDVSNTGDGFKRNMPVGPDVLKCEFLDWDEATWRRVSRRSNLSLHTDDDWKLGIAVSANQAELTGERVRISSPNVP